MHNEEILKTINDIKDRNARVELDKAWETSLTRKAIIAILTYAVIVIFFIYAKLSHPFINSIVPTLGFLLSTLSLGFAKRAWMRRKSKKLDSV